MFTSAMLDRLSEWLSNLSLVSLASIVLPALIGSTQKAIDIDVWFGFLSAVLSLWWSLRLARISERRK